MSWKVLVLSVSDSGVSDSQVLVTQQGALAELGGDFC